MINIIFLSAASRLVCTIMILFILIVIIISRTFRLLAAGVHGIIISIEWWQWIFLETYKLLHFFFCCSLHSKIHYQMWRKLVCASVRPSMENMLVLKLNMFSMGRLIRGGRMNTLKISTNFVANSVWMFGPNTHDTRVPCEWTNIYSIVGGSTKNVCI